eukprot:m.32725 g.32725  ORF g.32725 m.32725 type:complete len:60 (+) comp42546_c0_seq1:221-400(+)
MLWLCADSVSRVRVGTPRTVQDGLLPETVLKLDLLLCAVVLACWPPQLSITSCLLLQSR